MSQPLLRQPLLRGAKAVFFDFDGPLVSLFENHRAGGIAERMFAEQRRLRRADFPDSDDPHAVLAQLARGRRKRPRLVKAVDRLLTREEITAASCPGKAEGGAELVRELYERGTLLAITSNNSPKAIEVCLAPGGALEEVGDCFEGRIFGRGPNPKRMKPNPSCLTGAMRSVGLPASDCLLIGDSPSDVEAAERAKVPFLGFAATEKALDRLRKRDVDLVRGHFELLAELRL